MFLLIMSSLVYMIWQSYSVISVLFKGTTVTVINDGLIMLSHGIMVFLTVKRLMHLTGLVHEFRKRIDDVSEKLIDYEVFSMSCCCSCSCCCCCCCCCCFCCYCR